MKPNLKDFPKFPPMAQIPEGDIPIVVLQYLLNSDKWKETFEKELREMKKDVERDYEYYNEEMKKQGIPIGTDEAGLRTARASKFTLKQFIEKILGDES